MATTITLAEATRRRLADLKAPGQTYDQLVNELIDSMPIERVSTREKAIIDRRIRTLGRTIPAEELLARIRRDLKKGPTTSPPRVSRPRRRKGRAGRR